MDARDPTGGTTGLTETIGRNVIVGAASLVTQQVPPLAMGQPARVPRYRDGR